MFRILLDVDGVIADLVGALCAELEANGHRRTPDDFDRYEFDEVLTEGELAIVRRAMASPGFCASLPWYPGGRTFIQCLNTIADLVVVTKPFPAGRTWAHERQQWVKPYAHRVVHTAHKEVVRGNLLIEDHVLNADAWLSENPDGRVILIDRPWNQHLVPDGNDRVVRTHSFSSAAHFATLFSQLRSVA